MKAVIFHGIGDIRLEDAPDPQIKDPTDSIVRLTASAICGTDLHMVRGTLSPMVPGTILGHEGVGIVEDLGQNVRNFKKGDRVVLCSTIACGYCSYCRAGYYSQCDNANPNGKHAGTAFFGGPKMSGPFNGLQAEFARIPYSNVGMVKIPDEVSDEQAILVSDIFPTGYFGAELAEIEPSDTVVVFGCGPVGQFVIASARLLGAGRIFAVDRHSDRLSMAKTQGAEVIDFSVEDPVEVIRSLTGGIGADRAIDAVGVDAERPHEGPAAKKLETMKEEFETELSEIAPERPTDGNWKAGDAPSLVFTWALGALAKAGTLSIIGVYPETAKHFPIGMAMNKNLTLKAGNCDHRKYVPTLLDLVETGAVDPSKVLTKVEPLTSVLNAYQAFDTRQPGWIKVEIVPGMSAKREIQPWSFEPVTPRVQ